MVNTTAVPADPRGAQRTVALLHLRHSKGGGGGADAALFRDVSALDRKLFQPRVVYIRKHREQPSSMIQRLRDIGVPCLDLPGNAVVDLRQLLQLARLARATGTRILHCHDPKTAIYGYLLRLAVPRIRLVCTLHGWTITVHRELIYNWLTVRALRRFDAILAVSEKLRDQALAAGLARIHLIPNAIESDRWRSEERGSQQPRQGLAIGFVGRLSPEKAPLDFVRIARRVSEKAPRCEYFVAGEGPDRPAMEALSASLGVADRFHFQGHLGEEELRALYPRLDLLLLTSLTEGLPMVILEAFAMSLPVVATNVGGVAEIVEHGVNGFLAEPGDLDGLANGVLRLSESADMRASFGAAGRLRVERDFSAGARTAAIEKLYRSLLPED